MHRGCSVWTPTPPLAGQRTPRPGPARVCVRASLGWVGRAGLLGAFWCAWSLSCGRPLCFFGSFGPLRSAFALFVVVFGFCFSLLDPRCPCHPVFSGPWCPGPWRLVVLPFPPPLVFFVPFPLPPPAPFFFPLAFCLFAAPPFFVVFLFALVCWSCGVWAGSCVLRCGLCWCVLLWALCPGRGRFALVLCRWLLPGCAWSVCVVACPAAVSWCVLCFARCCAPSLCWAWFFPRPAAPCCRCLVPCRGLWLCSFLGCGAALLWWSFVVRCGAVCAVSCWWCRDVLFALAGAACCCLWLPAVRCWVWLPAVVFLWRVLSRVLLPGRVACRPAVCCGLLWWPAPLWCVLCSVVLCFGVVPCCAALLSVSLCWWYWFVSFPCVCGAVSRCASCCWVLGWSALLLVPRAVVCRCVLWCLACRSVAWRCCSGVWWSLAVPCCVLWCCVALWCRAAGVCCVLCFAAAVPFSFKNYFFNFEKKVK